MGIEHIADEVHQSRVHQHPVVAFCSACGKEYFLSNLTFVQIKGRCSCSWHCCQAAEPGNRPHERHMAERPATAEDEKRAEAGEMADFREVMG